MTATVAAKDTITTTNRVPLSTFPIVSGEFLKRPNRFIAEIAVIKDGLRQEIKAHVPNTGRMQELLTPGAPVRLAYAPSPSRKTDYTLLSVEYQGIWVCVYAAMANALAFEYVKGLPGVTEARREVTYRNSRFDLAFSLEKKACLYEVKSANLVVDGCAMFPDAPTQRGARHLEELMEAQTEGYRTGVFFIVQREDAVFFAPNEATDPKFAALLRQGRARGLDIRALRCRVSEDYIAIEAEIPVVLD
ncbi:MAG: DNA/RNA nuclease SfsA [Eubacterium sp.]|nr:DNA/RNA nuclease SfsA [Eubacterium sp.]